MKTYSLYQAAFLAISGTVMTIPNAAALELDWSGQFRSEAHLIHNYALDSNAGLINNTTVENLDGYYIPGGGSTNANFQTLFLRLRPKLVVNDNVYIKSEWWVGDPIYGIMGSNFPTTFDKRQFYSTQSDGFIISAQRIWAELVTDIGTVQVGRAPLHWGLGLVWHNGDGLWDRYESTGDMVRLVSKFGSFSLAPAIINYSSGNNISGACFMSGGTCTSVQGSGGVSDYSIAFKYENTDEDFEGGVNFIKRLASSAQDPQSGILGIGSASDAAPPAAGSNFNTWDLFAKKKFGRFTLSGEAPIASGDIGGIPYQSYAFALEGNLKVAEAWEATLKAGRAAGQPNIQGNQTDKVRVFYMNPNYRLGTIMFNYQLANFAGPNTTNNPNVSESQLKSPFDNPIVNANYINLGGAFQMDKWRFNANVIHARAIETAGEGAFFNTWQRKYVTNGSGKSQSNMLGWEFDLGANFAWDDAFIANLDLAWFLPGDYFKFANSPTYDNPTSSVLAGIFRIGMTF